MRKSLDLSQVKSSVTSSVKVGSKVIVKIVSKMNYSNGQNWRKNERRWKIYKHGNKEEEKTHKRQ